MRVRSCIFALAVFVMLTPLAAYAQFRVDTTRTGAKPAEDTAHWHMTRSPTTAIILSAVLPGAGQVYLNQWWKVPIIYAGIGGFLAGALLQNSRYHYTADSVNNQLARGEVGRANAYANAREFYRDDRDKYYIYAALMYIANILDAYISAHLFDFDVSDEGSPRKMLNQPYSPSTLHLRIGFHTTF